VEARYIGVDDDGQVIGISDTDIDIEKLSSMIKDKIKPSILNYISIEKKSTDSREIIEIEVRQGDGKPYYLAEKGMRPSGVYMRLGNTSIPVKESNIRKMIIDNQGLTYETTRALKQNLTFDYFLDQFRSIDVIVDKSNMRSLELVDEDGLYNNLSLLMSDQCPHIIKVAVFQDDDKMTFRFRKEFKGSLLKQLNDVFEFIELQNNMVTIYNGLKRQDLYDYNLSSVREALVNAIVHRDYGINGSIFVNMYSSFMEFISIGSLPEGMTYEDIVQGVSKPRNEKLAQIFYRLNLIESFGTGIRKIMHAYKGHERQPEFVETPNAFIVRLPKFKHDDAVVKESSADYYSHSLNYLDDDAVKRDVILLIEKFGHITRKDIQSRYGFSQTKSGTIIRQLEAEGLIKRNGSGKNTYYILKR
jgi:ATP-dependent DNA helicase RecG